MKIFQKQGRTLFLSILMAFSVSSCDLFDLDINTDPNNPSQAAPDLLLANAQLDGMVTFADNLNDATMGFVGITSQFDDFNMTNSSWDVTWNFLYQGPLNDIERIIMAATEAGNNPRYLGVAQIMKAYYFSLMVDLWGDVPYSQAFKGDQGVKTPAYDDDAAIYQDLLSLLDQALTNLDQPSAVAVSGDLIYNGNIARWKKAANSLKLRLLLQRRRVDTNAGSAIQALVDQHNATAGGIFITSAADDFVFRFSKTQNPDNRHPMYVDGYGGGEAAYDYFGHKYMAEMLANRDPRTPFYFKRQTSAVLNLDDPSQKQTAPCSQRDDCIYSYFPLSPFVTNLVYGKTPAGLTGDEASYLAGFFGRDRSDPSGIPNDNSLRTTVGAYPAAGLFDDVAEEGGDNKGAGDGIFPMITTWMVDFYLMEAQLELGVDVGMTNEELLEDALNKQIAKVFAVGAAADPTIVTDVAEWPATYDWPIQYEEVDDFVATQVAGYTAASNKLNYLMKQAWFANFGNGFELYNAFRRTRLPNDLQEPLQLPRQFALRLPYSLTEINLNSSTPTVVYDSPSSAVFWDVEQFQF